VKEKTEEDTRRWKYLSRSWIRRINTVKLAIILKAIYRFNAMPIKIPMSSFHRNRKINPKTFMDA
jgi:hypothetical protein